MPMELIRAHLTWLQAAGRAANTINDRSRLLRHANRHLPHGLNYASEDEIASYLARPDWSDWTRYTYRQHISGYYVWAVRRGHLTLDPTADLPKPKQGPTLPQPCTDEELAIALTAPAPYARAMWLAAYAGLRCHEIVAAHRSHIADGQLRVLGKGGKVRMVPINHMLDNELWSERGQLLGVDWTPHKLTKRQRDAWHTVGLSPAMHLHRGRHWFATRLLEEGADVRVVQQLLGHSSLATTEGYLAVTDVRTRLAVTRLPRVFEPAPIRLEDSVAA